VSAFGERYLLASFPTGGVIVDLETGNYFRVDAAAAQICDALMQAPDAAAAAAWVAQRLMLPRQDAAHAVEHTRAALAAAPARGTPQGSYHFYPRGSGYVLRHGDRDVLLVDGGDLAVRLPPVAGVDINPRLELYARALAPKIMFLRGLTVLHASACVAGGGLVAFAGTSGAGKTTTAQAFARAGATLVGEDLLVVEAAGAGPPLVALGGEAWIGRWASRAAQALAAGTPQVASDELAAVPDGARAPLRAVLFLEAARRAGTELGARSLAAPDGLVALMANDFLGAASPDEWRRFFATAVAIASSTELLEATVPAGVAALEGAARRYMSSWTS